MKRITKVNLHNYRAFFGDDYHLLMPNGENVLIYGENGSGKSSIYNALKDFFESSDKPALKFQRHVYGDGAGDGSVEIFFSEFPQTDPLTPYDKFDFNTIQAKRTADTSSYLRKANKARAFLSYQELVRSYLAPKDDLTDPNLYGLIIETLLANHTLKGPNTIGKTIQARWLEIKTGLDVNSARYSDFKEAKNSLPGFEQDLIEVLKPILIETNRYLVEYFNNDIKIDIGALLVRTHKHTLGKGWWTDQLLRLQVNLFTDVVHNGYQHRLNEARLSAIAICLYLAAIKKSPQPDEYKIIFLDDIFIGLDTSNRIPLLELIKAEFPEHQIFISTYDRFWYETAKRWFDNYLPNKWKYYEFYVNNKEHIPGKTFDKPIVSNAKSNWEKGIYYLQHDFEPDYPSAANSFRKYLEEIIKKYIPDFETRNSSVDKIEDYKLTATALITKRFLLKIGQDDKYINDCINALPTLLHPLSHFETKAPIYKLELIKIRDAIQHLEVQLKYIKEHLNVRCALSKGKTLRMNYQIEPNHNSYYIIYLNEPLCKFLNAGTLTFSLASCNYLEVYGNNNGTILNKRSFKKTDLNYRYLSLEDAYTKTHAFLIGLPNPHFSTIPLLPNYIDAFQISDDGITFNSLNTLLI